MNKLKLNIFEIFSLSWISVTILSLLFAMTGHFSNVSVVWSLVFVIVLLVIFYRKGTFQFTKPSTLSLSLLVAILVFSALLSHYTTPTIFGGRDEGSYSNAAIMLSREHDLTTKNSVVNEFFEIYRTGKALNFPGFYYTVDGHLKSQFLPGFVTWIAILYSLFGLKGIAYVNMLPLLTFLFSYYYILKKLLLGRQFLSKEATLDKTEKVLINKYTVIGVVFLLSCFPLVLFYKFTLSEIFFASLIWFTFYLILKYFEFKSFPHYLLIFIPFSLMLFTRIESIGFVFILFFLFVLKDFTHMRQAKYQFIYAILALVMVISMMISSNFFVDTAKNILEPILEPNNSSAQSIFSDDLANFYLPKVLFNYNILPLILMGSLYVLYLLKRKKNRLLIPFFFFLPTLIYLVDANISLDHPWMLRRFMFSIIPLFTMYATLFLFDLHKRSNWLMNFRFISYSIATLIFIINLLLLFPNLTRGYNFITYQQNTGLLEQTQQLASLFGDNDLVLISQKASGSGWSLISEPLSNLYGKKAVYFFNPENLPKISSSKFDNIYLITSDEEKPLYEKIKMEKVRDYSISNTTLLPSRNPEQTATVNNYQTKGTIYKIQK